jgi:hypothetical protein
MNSFDRAVFGVLSLAGLLSLCWSFVLFAAQCVGWLVIGNWQPLALFSLFLHATQRAGQPIPSDLFWWLVPNFSNANGTVSMSLLKPVTGFQKIASWLFFEPTLSMWLLIAGGALYMLAAALEASA